MARRGPSCDAADGGVHGGEGRGHSVNRLDTDSSLLIRVIVSARNGAAGLRFGEVEAVLPEFWIGQDVFEDVEDLVRDFDQALKGS